MPKYQEIFDKLRGDIVAGHYGPGQKLPSEAALVKRFATSRITVGRALRELQQSGLVDRVAGSGTYARNGVTESQRNLLFGLIIPNLGETEIFEPICQGIANSPDSTGHALLWTHSTSSNKNGSSRADDLLELCRHCLERSVSGVFFAPLELSAGADDVNRQVLTKLRSAGVPTVLLDRRPEESASRHRCDLVGIDNHRAGYLATEHLLQNGARRIGFVSYQHQASTVGARLSGFHEALARRSLRAAGTLTASVSDRWQGAAFRAGKYDAFVCSNDRIAGHVMHALLARGVRIPEDVAIVGIDDVAYASLLPVPLTTVHQPCRDIGETALRLMLERLNRPKMPARDVLLDCYLVIRESCGSRQSESKL